MKKMLLFGIIGLVVVVIAIESFYLIKQNRELKKNQVQVENEQSPDKQGNNSNNKDSQLYVGDDFTIMSPRDWSRAGFASTLVSWRNASEQHPDGSSAKKINFKSYIAVSFDNPNGKSLGEIVELVKKQIESVAPGITFTAVTDGMIDWQPAKFIEAELNMQDEKFKVLMIVILKGDKYFTISNNTTAEKWSEYRDLFYETANSFRFKY